MDKTRIHSGFETVGGLSLSVLSLLTCPSHFHLSVALPSFQCRSYVCGRSMHLTSERVVLLVAWPGLEPRWRDINVKRRGQGRSCPITLHPVTAIRPQNNRGGKD